MVIHHPSFATAVVFVCEEYTLPRVLIWFTVVPFVHDALDADPGGSLRIISKTLGPLVTKLLPVGFEPRITASRPFSLHFFETPSTS